VPNFFGFYKYGQQAGFLGWIKTALGTYFLAEDGSVSPRF
jgi:hypothetical protein